MDFVSRVTKCIPSLETKKLVFRVMSLCQRSRQHIGILYTEQSCYPPDKGHDPTMCYFGPSARKSISSSPVGELVHASSDKCCRM